MSAYATLEGNRVISGTVHVPGFGQWVADVELDAIPALPLSGLVTLVVGDLRLVGTIVPSASGTFAEQAWYRIVAGGAGWSRILPARAYHNDAGIKRALLLNDAAFEAGEQLAGAAALFGPLSATELDPPAVPGVDFIRAAGPASRIFGQVIDASEAASGWWVDFAGVTHVGPRPTPIPDPTLEYALLDYFPGRRVAVLATETPSAIAVGMTIAASALAAPLTVREFDIELTAETLRVRAWVDEAGATGALDDRMVRALRSLVRETFPQLAYLGTYRYRVVSMTAFRASLQIVRRRTGLPDQTLIRIAPGSAGLWADLTPGAIVLVGFAEGDPSQPYIANHPARGEPGHEPATARLVATGTVRIDAPKVVIGNLESVLVTEDDEELKRVVRYGDTVAVGPAGPLTGAKPDGTGANYAEPVVIGEAIGLLVRDPPTPLSPPATPTPALYGDSVSGPAEGVLVGGAPGTQIAYGERVCIAAVVGIVSLPNPATDEVSKVYS